MLLRVCLILRSALRACPRPELGARLEGRTTVIQLFVSIPSGAPLLQRFGLAKPMYFRRAGVRGSAHEVVSVA